MISFSQLLKDIEQLKGKRLKSIKSGSDLVIDYVDYDNENVVVHVADNPGRQNSRPFREFETIWNDMAQACLTNNPWVSVETALGGSGSSRNQPETIIANLPYVVWSRPNNRKCIAYVGRTVHSPGENKEADNSDLVTMRDFRDSEHSNSLKSKPHNWIFFGAPGTGKSYQLDKLAKESFAKENVARVTFYPDYTYSQFVGCYKPCTDENDAITYGYVAGPFLDTYLKACTHPNDQFILIVEEINRANPAAVFGDVFQLLDRRADGGSEYSVAVPADMRKCIESVLDGLTEQERNAIESYFDPDMDFSEFCAAMTNDLALPPNMYIWATMNSADQGVFPMDTAFKRRWSFRYIGIDDGEDAEVTIGEEKKRLNEVVVNWGDDDDHKANWNNLRKAINGFLSNDVKVNEDKLLGPFFVNPASLADGRFADAFKDKVLLYLYEDACKTKHSKVFANDLNTYSAVCNAFDERGTGIFVDGFRKYYEKEAAVTGEDADSSEE